MGLSAWVGADSQTVAMRLRDEWRACVNAHVDNVCVRKSIQTYADSPLLSAGSRRVFPACSAKHPAG